MMGDNDQDLVDPREDFSFSPGGGGSALEAAAGSLAEAAGGGKNKKSDRPWVYTDEEKLLTHTMPISVSHCTKYQKLDPRILEPEGLLEETVENEETGTKMVATQLSGALFAKNLRYFVWPMQTIPKMSRKRQALKSPVYLDASGKRRYFTLAKPEADIFRDRPAYRAELEPCFPIYYLNNALRIQQGVNEGAKKWKLSIEKR
ncbi:unnamed protein product, partial [Amoebophrya sp. A25]|eukprot:GSA25T00022313001.1